jgi:carboxylesterase
MKLPTTKTLGICQPIRVQGSGTGVLLLHGYTGCPYSFRNLVSPLIEQGYTVYAPRYPGHGTNGEDFLTTNWRDWLRAAQDAYYDLSAMCNTVHTIGFSMGGAISLILASSLKIKKLVLIAPALFISGWKIKFSSILSLFFKKLPSGYFEESSMQEYQYLVKEYLSYYWPSQASSLLKLARLARQSVGRVRSKTLILAGAKDTIVPMKAAKFVYEKIATVEKTLEIFEDSEHDLLNGPQSEQVVNTILSWLRDQS